MLTPNKLDRLWHDCRYRQLIRDVLAGRPEAGLGLDARLGGPLAAAALTLLRLGELNQTGLPIVDDLRGRLLMSRNADGSWGDAADRPILTAICVRALSALPHAPQPRAGSSVASHAPRMTLGLAGFGSDVRGVDRAVAAAVDAGVAYLAASQHPDGGWGVPPATAFDTGFVLLQLGRLESFRVAVRLSEALDVGRRARMSVDDATTLAVWSRMRMRCGQTLNSAATPKPPGQSQMATFVFAEVA